MTILRVGTNEKYSNNWDSIFGGKKKAAKKVTAKKATKKAAKKKKATKKKK
ncbi:MAG: hypothetical protein AAFX06_25090 [Planctomycetota bacterium]